MVNFILSSGKVPPAFPASLPPQPSTILACHAFTIETPEKGSRIWILTNLISVFGAGSHREGTEAPRWHEGRIRQVQVGPLLFQFLQWLPLTQLNWWQGGGLLLPGADIACEQHPLLRLRDIICSMPLWKGKAVNRSYDAVKRMPMYVKYPQCQNTETSSWTPSL